MCHSFLDEFHVINGGDFLFVEMAKKMRIWRIIFDFWNLVKLFLNRLNTDHLHSIINHFYLFRLAQFGLAVSLARLLETFSILSLPMSTA